MLINPENEEIISLAFEKGEVHDFDSNICIYKKELVTLQTN